MKFKHVYDPEYMELFKIFGLNWRDENGALLFWLTKVGDNKFVLTTQEIQEKRKERIIELKEAYEKRKDGDNSSPFDTGELSVLELPKIKDLQRIQKKIIKAPEILRNIIYLSREWKFEEVKE